MADGPSVEKTKNPRVATLLEAKNDGNTAYLIDALTAPEDRGIAAMLLGKMGATEAIPPLTRHDRAQLGAAR